jgi:hypothetical protein
MLGLRPLLEHRFRRFSRRGGRRRDRLTHRAPDERARLFEAALQIHRTDDRLVQARRKTGALPSAGVFLPSPEPRALGQREAAADVGERGRGDKGGAERGELAFARVGEPPEELLADDEVDDGVAEELEALEVPRLPVRRVLVQVRAVRKRAREQRRVAEAVPGDLARPLLQR